MPLRLPWRAGGLRKFESLVLVLAVLELVFILHTRHSDVGHVALEAERASNPTGSLPREPREGRKPLSSTFLEAQGASVDLKPRTESALNINKLETNIEVDQAPCVFSTMPVCSGPTSSISCLTQKSGCSSLRVCEYSHAFFDPVSHAATLMASCTVPTQAAFDLAADVTRLPHFVSTDTDRLCQHPITGRAILVVRTGPAPTTPTAILAEAFQVYAAQALLGWVGVDGLTPRVMHYRALSDDAQPSPEALTLAGCYSELAVVAPRDGHLVDFVSEVDPVMQQYLKSYIADLLKGSSGSPSAMQPAIGIVNGLRRGPVDDILQYLVSNGQLQQLALMNMPACALSVFDEARFHSPLEFARSINALSAAVVTSPDDLFWVNPKSTAICLAGGEYAVAIHAQCNAVAAALGRTVTLVMANTECSLELCSHNIMPITMQLGAVCTGLLEARSQDSNAMPQPPDLMRDLHERLVRESRPDWAVPRQDNGAHARAIHPGGQVIGNRAGQQVYNQFNGHAGGAINIRPRSDLQAARNPANEFRFNQGAYNENNFDADGRSFGAWGKYLRRAAFPMSMGPCYPDDWPDTISVCAPGSGLNPASSVTCRHLPSTGSTMCIAEAIRMGTDHVTVAAGGEDIAAVQGRFESEEFPGIPRGSCRPTASPRASTTRACRCTTATS
eukprot:m.24649 g.24649  ORF g.24649 m.24649 type:complete len:673 (-) comp4040_c0_seq1:1144-3162(-)